MGFIAGARGQEQGVSVVDSPVTQAFKDSDPMIALGHCHNPSAMRIFLYD